jgi:cyanophycinase-like exopeptidase
MMRPTLDAECPQGDAMYPTLFANGGALVLWSTTPEPAPAALIDRIIARRPRSAGASVRIVVLQTPLPDPQREQVDMLEQHFSGHAAPIQIVDGGLQTRNDAYDPATIARIDDADLILVTGGNPERMADAIRDTPAEDALRQVVQRGGVVGGGSAGAMVWGRAVPSGAAANPTGSLPLLGWLPDLVVAPHFGMYPIDAWRDLFPGATILGLPDGAVVLLEADTHGELAITGLGEIAAHLLSSGAPTRILAQGANRVLGR